jgi:hypothetical protein
MISWACVRYSLNKKLKESRKGIKGSLGFRLDEMMCYGMVGSGTACRDA